MYWLKPFDAVNDAANAVALLQADWSKGPALEIGGGDGVFSFIMHGGAFGFSDDRYDQTDLSRSDDIYDAYQKNSPLNIRKPSRFQYDAGIDLKLSHLLKSKETQLYRDNNLVSAKPEHLPIKDDTFSTVFLYTFHGLTDYSSTLKEIRRVLNNEGTLLMIAANDIVKEHFVCHKLHKYFEMKGWKKLSDYFQKLDGRRYEEIGGIFSKSIEEWNKVLYESGFRIEEVYTQVSPFLWKLYDTQTRPVLKLMIRCNQFLARVHLKLPIKFLWMCLWLPVLMVSYLLMAVPNKLKADSIPQGVFFTVKAKTV